MWWTCVCRYTLYISESCYYLLMMIHVIGFWIMLFDCTSSVCNLPLGLRSKLEFTMFLSRLVYSKNFKILDLRKLLWNKMMLNCDSIFPKSYHAAAKLPYFKDNVWEFFINQRSSIIHVCIFLTNRVRYHNNFNLMKTYS